MQGTRYLGWDWIPERVLDTAPLVQEPAAVVDISNIPEVPKGGHHWSIKKTVAWALQIPGLFYMYILIEFIKVRSK